MAATIASALGAAVLLVSSTAPGQDSNASLVRFQGRAKCNTGSSELAVQAARESATLSAMGALLRATALSESLIERVQACPEPARSAALEALTGCVEGSRRTTIRGMRTIRDERDGDQVIVEIAVPADEFERVSQSSRLTPRALGSMLEAQGGVLPTLVLLEFADPSEEETWTGPSDPWRALAAAAGPGVLLQGSWTVPTECDLRAALHLWCESMGGLARGGVPLSACIGCLPESMLRRLQEPEIALACLGQRPNDKELTKAVSGVLDSWGFRKVAALVRSRPCAVPSCVDAQGLDPERRATALRVPIVALALLSSGAAQIALPLGNDRRTLAGVEPEDLVAGPILELSSEPSAWGLFRFAVAARASGDPALALPAFLLAGRRAECRQPALAGALQCLRDLGLLERAREVLRTLDAGESDSLDPDLARVIASVQEWVAH